MDLVTVANAVIQTLPTAEAVANTVNQGGVLYWPVGAGIAAGLAVLGAGIGIGKLVAAALEGSARQPEMMGKLQTMMILGIAFVEALALIALMVFPFLIKP